MASAMKNLTGEIKTRLDAAAGVTVLLANGADSIYHWHNEQTDDISGTPKPYISINPMPRGDTVEKASYRDIELIVEVEYVIDDSAHKTDISFYDEAEQVDLILRGANLDNPTFGNDKAFRNDLREDYIKEDGQRKVVFELEYIYKQNK